MRFLITHNGFFGDRHAPPVGMIEKFFKKLESVEWLSDSWSPLACPCFKTSPTFSGIRVEHQQIWEPSPALPWLNQPMVKPPNRAPWFRLEHIVEGYPLCTHGNPWLPCKWWARRINPTRKLFLAGPIRREWRSLNLYMGILGIHEPSFPTNKGQLVDLHYVFFFVFCIFST